MSTKGSIAYENDEATGHTFHLYEECFEDGNIYLELTGFPFEASSGLNIGLDEVNPHLVVKFPVEWAKKLGLVGPNFRPISSRVEGSPL
jgi:hypothetical protein